MLHESRLSIRNETHDRFLQRLKVLDLPNVYIMLNALKMMQTPDMLM